MTIDEEKWGERYGDLKARIVSLEKDVAQGITDAREATKQRYILWVFIAFVAFDKLQELQPLLKVLP